MFIWKTNLGISDPSYAERRASPFSFARNNTACHRKYTYDHTIRIIGRRLGNQLRLVAVGNMPWDPPPLIHAFGDSVPLVHAHKSYSFGTPGPVHIKIMQHRACKLDSAFRSARYEVRPATATTAALTHQPGGARQPMSRSSILGPPPLVDPTSPERLGHMISAL